jgi:DnaJ-class molecular chaperone
MSWLKGTEWRWNNDGNWGFKMERSGDIDAPIQQCQMGCKWTAQKGKVYLSMGDAGIFTLDAQEEKPADMNGFRMKGRSQQDGQRLTLTFVRVFDHEAADLEKDLYGALGLSDDADEAEIKKVYRKLSIKYHPDKNPDEASRKIFNDVRDAYEILNDPDKKILYDTGGMEAVKKGDKGDIQKTDDVNSELEVSLNDLYNSNTMKAGLQRRVVCRGCRRKPDAPQCSGCGRCPNEIKVVNVQMGPFVTQQQQEVPSKEKCKQADATIDVHIEKGMREGESLTYPRMAEERPGMLPGSVILKLKTKKHPLFVRRSDDLHIDMKVSLREALLGWSQTVRHLDGHTIELATKDVTRHSQVVKAKNEGMPLRDDPSSFGDLLVKISIDFPKELDETQKQEFAKIFPPSPERPIL